MACALLQAATHDLSLFVCCHAARDARCGQLGPPLAASLHRLVRARGLEEHVAVYATSHIGGHKYAGNVVCYGAVHPCDGDWFGGVNAGNAESFLDALLAVEVCGAGCLLLPCFMIAALPAALAEALCACSPACSWAWMAGRSMRRCAPFGAGAWGLARRSSGSCGSRWAPSQPPGQPDNNQLFSISWSTWFGATHSPLAGRRH